ncbi:MAG: efflux RND transporter periplasmic adaptor subunit [Chloroflexi bacterium]|nr:efflux RND transporter periplasmic adaptor subunit [Chloroflexota bacterium]
MAIAAGVLALAAACGSSQPATTTTPAAPSGALKAVPVNVSPATIGTISLTTTFPATVDFAQQVNLSPLTAGRIEKVYVDLGAQVKQGQLIAELSHGTLDTQLVQAQATLRQAQSRLNTLKAPSSPLSVAQAQADQLLRPTASDLQVANSAVATAQATLDTANIKLDQLLHPSASDLQAASSAVATAQANLDSAKIKLAQTTGPSPSDIAASQATLAAADSSWRTNRSAADTAIATQAVSRALSDQMRSWLQGLASARAQSEAAQAALDSLPQVLGRTLTSDDTASLQRDVDQAQAQAASFLTLVLQSRVSLPTIDAALAAENSAKASLESAKAKLQALLSPDANTIALAQSTVKTSQAALDTAQAKLKDLQNPDPNVIALARVSVASTKAALDSAQARVTVLMNPTAASLASAQAAIGTAQQGLNDGQIAVDQAQAQVDSITVQLGQTQVLAPFDGTVTQRFLSAGSNATTQTAVVALASKAISISINVSESSVRALSSGQAATVSGPSLPGPGVSLSITTIAPSGDAAAHTFAVQLRDDTGASGFRPGMSAQVSIPTRRDQTTLVPREAVVQREGAPSIFVLDGINVKLRKVTTGLSDDRRVEVLTGVKADEQVVLSPPLTMVDGDPVIARTPTPPPPGTPQPGGQQNRPPSSAVPTGRPSP